MKRHRRDRPESLITLGNRWRTLVLLLLQPVCIGGRESERVRERERERKRERKEEKWEEINRIRKKKKEEMVGGDSSQYSQNSEKRRECERRKRHATSGNNGQTRKKPIDVNQCNYAAKGRWHTRDI